MSQKKAPSMLLSMAKMKCPNCRTGNMYTKNSVFPFRTMMDMPEHCSVCNQKFEIEPGFWYGTGYVSYAISVGSIFIITMLYVLIVGFSWNDNSIYKLIGVIIGTMVALQPWIMRYSRVFYLYVFVKYQKGHSVRDQN